MKAITLHRPWAYAIAYLGKDIENRSWRCYLAPGTRFAIHAGKKWDHYAAGWIFQNLGVQVPPEAEHAQGIVATAIFAGNLTESESDWFVGDVGWLLRDVVPLQTPVPCKGTQGLWTVPAPQLTEIMNQQQQESAQCQNNRHPFRTIASILPILSNRQCAIVNN